MSDRSYKAYLDALLTPLGFTRTGKDWSRVRDGLKETVNLQVSNIAGSTINLEVVNLDSARIADEIAPGSGEFYMRRSQRIGHLIDNHDHWWRRDPDGPADLTEAVRIYGLPYFDQMRSLEDAAGKWVEWESQSRWHGPTMIWVAITLYRMGRVEEALAVLSLPPPKRAIPAWVARVDQVRRWIEDHRGGG